MHTQSNTLPTTNLYFKHMTKDRRPNPAQLLSPRELRRILAEMLD